MEKVDLKSVQRELYAPPRGRFVEVVVPPMRFLAVDGSGAPGTSESYRTAVEALFTASYAAKFAARRTHGRDHVVLPLEGLWWADDMTVFHTRDKDAWSWRLLVRQPDHLTDDDLDAAVTAARAKGADADHRLHTYAYDEGRCVQTLHVGPYDAEAPTIRALHEEHLPAHGLRPTGHHHEIYLSDARRVAPERLRTILRQPVAALAG